MSALRITQDHEWIRMESADVGRVGITQFAQEQLGDIVFVELPALGRKLKAGDEAAVIESVKAAAECRSPVSGTVTEVNGALADDPATVNRDPTGAGWFFRMRIDDPAELEGLMDEDTYGAKLGK
jgi:glycine cleavage system H protein